MNPQHFSRPLKWNARHLLLLLMGFVVSELNVGVSAPPSSPTDEKPAVTTYEPISVDDAPKELQRLITDGKVKVVYDSDPKFVMASRGWADFNVRVEHSFKYRSTTLTKNGQRRLRITVTKLEPVIELTHLIRLPASFKSPEIWQSQILRHEFDHVAVNLDPRAMLLLRHLLTHLSVIERTLEPDEEPSKEQVRQIISDEVDRRRQAVVELMRQNNLRLDKLGAHGVQPVPDRAAFFARLYSKEHLAEQKFPFVDQVLSLLAAAKYENAELPFLRRDPTEP